MGKRVNTAVWLDKYKRWQIKVQKDGERRTFTCSTPGRTGQRECNAKADAWLDDGICNAQYRVKDLYALYLNDLKDRTSRSHWQNEETYGRIWILPIIGNMRISQVNNQHLQNVINAAFKAGKAKKTLKNIRSSISAFYKFCRKCKATREHPEEIVVPQSAPTSVRRIVQPTDLVKLFSEDATVYRGRPVRDELINAYRLQAVTGMRPGELIGLMWDDIQDDDILVHRSINVFGETTNGKNENAVRIFAIPDIAKPLLQDQLQYKDLYEGYLFPRLCEQTYLNRWKKYCNTNGIPEVTLYELRHTFVSAVQSLPESQIKLLVGHSRSMDTFGIYGHETTGLRKEIAGNVDRVFKSILHEE